MKERRGLKGVKQREGGVRQGGKRAPVIKEMKESRDGVKEEEEVVYRWKANHWQWDGKGNYLKEWMRNMWEKSDDGMKEKDGIDVRRVDVWEGRAV